jgi:hypothetical protein
VLRSILRKGVEGQKWQQERWKWSGERCVVGQTVRAREMVGVSVLVPTQTYKRRGAEDVVLFFLFLDRR